MLSDRVAVTKASTDFTDFTDASEPAAEGRHGEWSKSGFERLIERLRRLSNPDLLHPPAAGLCPAAARCSVVSVAVGSIRVIGVIRGCV
jgi:hypothetical protein